MKTLRQIVGISIVFCGTLPSYSQGAFQNMNFEEANSVVTTYPYVTVASALPFWSVYYGAIQQTQVSFEVASGGGNQVTLVSASNPYYYSAIDGNYSVVLQANPVNSTSISQDGTIPANAQSLQFDSIDILGTGVVNVSFAGNTLTPTLLSAWSDPSGQTYDVYGVNIAAYASQTGVLQFNVPTPSLYYVELDDVLFSPNSVAPEPNMAALTAIGGLLFGARKRFARP